MVNKGLLSKIESGALKSNEVLIPNIFNTLNIENAKNLSQNELDDQLKTYLCQNNGLLQILKLPKNQDGTQSYGQLNQNGSVSVGVELKNGERASMEDYYKQYPWNKPGLSGEERTELFNNRPAVTPFLQAPPDSPTVDCKPSITGENSSATFLKPNDSAQEEQQITDGVTQRNTPS